MTSTTNSLVCNHSQSQKHFHAVLPMLKYTPQYQYLYYLVLSLLVYIHQTCKSFALSNHKLAEHWHSYRALCHTVHTSLVMYISPYPIQAQESNLYFVAKFSICNHGFKVSCFKFAYRPDYKWDQGVIHTFNSKPWEELTLIMTALNFACSAALTSHVILVQKIPFLVELQLPSPPGITSLGQLIIIKV